MTESNVVGLKGQPVVDRRTPLPEVIKQAEWILEAAKSGEIVGFAIAVDYSDSATGNFRTGMVSYSTVGRLQMLSKRILEDLAK
jgi:hypothetical protein